MKNFSETQNKDPGNYYTNEQGRWEAEASLEAGRICLQAEGHRSLLSSEAGAAATSCAHQFCCVPIGPAANLRFIPPLA